MDAGCNCGVQLAAQLIRAIRRTGLERRILVNCTALLASIDCGRRGIDDWDPACSARCVEDGYGASLIYTVGAKPVFA